MRIAAPASLASKALLLMLLLPAAGCGADDAPPRPEDASARSPTAVSVDPQTLACEPGRVRECKVDLPTYEGVESCFVGVQLCAEGRWGECVDVEALEEQLAALDAATH